MKVTSEQFDLLQKIFTISRMGHPCQADIVNQAMPLLEAGYVEMEGKVEKNGSADLNIPFEIQQALASGGQFLKVR